MGRRSSPSCAAPPRRGMSWTAAPSRQCGRAYLLRGLGVPNLDVVEVAVLAADADFDLRLGGVADAGGLEIGDRLAVDRDPHRLADGLDDEGVPLLRLELDRKREAG